MKKPFTPLNMNLGNFSVGFDANALDLLATSHGVQLVHYAAMPCPLGRVFEDDLRQPNPHDHSLCQNGFVYQKKGTITAILQYNTHNIEMVAPGRIDHSVCQATFPRTYDDNDETFDVLQYDKFFYLDSFTLPTFEDATFNLTGVDRLRYPVEKVDFLMDARGRTYTQDVDFVVENGLIKWGSNNPGMETSTGDGVLYSVRYSYKPWFICANLVHEARVVQTSTPTGTEATMLPKQVILKREFFYHDQEVGAGTDRETGAAKKSSFGPR